MTRANQVAVQKHIEEELFLDWEGKQTTENKTIICFDCKEPELAGAALPPEFDIKKKVPRSVRLQHPVSATKSMMLMLLRLSLHHRPILRVSPLSFPNKLVTEALSPLLSKDASLTSFYFIFVPSQEKTFP